MSSGFTLGDVEEAAAFALGRSGIFARLVAAVAESADALAVALAGAVAGETDGGSAAGLGGLRSSGGGDAGAALAAIGDASRAPLLPANHAKATASTPITASDGPRRLP